jgi:AMMECR1 domain-containing protein
MSLVIHRSIVFVLLTAAAAWAVELEPLVDARPDQPLGPPPPAVKPLDQTYLMRFVRRVLVHRVRDGSRYEPEYIPLALHDLRCRAAVTLRREGRLLGTGDSNPLPVVEACREAAETALTYARRKAVLREADLDNVTIEIELVGPRERVGWGNDLPEQLADRFIRSVHGVAIRLHQQELLVRPSQVIAMEPLCFSGDELDHRCDRYMMVLESLQEKLGLMLAPPDQPGATVARFRTTHWYEPAPDADPVELISGLRPVRPEEVTRQHLLEVVEDLARYLRHRQEPGGLFLYEFLPGRDMFWEDQNWIRQAGTAWTLAYYARHTGCPESTEAIGRTLETFARMARPMQDQRGAMFIATPDNQHALGTTALVCLALLDAPQREQYADLRAGLLAAMAAMQRPDGSFRTHFPPSPAFSSQDYFPGEALLALARDYTLTREARWRAVCDRALPFYIDYFRRHQPPAFVPWQAQAWSHMALSTRLDRYADFVFEMSDFIADMQLSAETGLLPIFEGALNVHGTGYAGISTAVYMEGLIDAARTAEVFGDRRRAARYRQVIHNAARFVLQLRFKPEEAYYVASPSEVIGGMRNTPFDPTLRIDHVQHALAALLGAVELMPASTQPAGDDQAAR